MDLNAVFSSTWIASTLALVAVVLSQMPPLHQLLQRKRVSFDVSELLVVRHWFGVPQMQVLVSVTNQGGRHCQVRRISARFERDSQHLVELVAYTYFPDSSNTTVILSPFTLAPFSDWSRNCLFTKILARDVDREIRAIQGVVNEHLPPAVQQGAASGTIAIPGPLGPGLSGAITRAETLFERNFIWNSGEYRVTFKVELENGRTHERSYRFVVFDEQADALRNTRAAYQRAEGMTADRPLADHHVNSYVILRPEG